MDDFFVCGASTAIQTVTRNHFKSALIEYTHAWYVSRVLKYKNRLILRIFIAGVAAVMIQSQPLAAPTIETFIPEVDAKEVEVLTEEISAAAAFRRLSKVEVEARVREYFSDIPVMIDVAYCESKFNQHGKDGNVLRGVVRDDMRVMQINDYYHCETAEKLGIDLHTLEGNLAYARYLYNREGTRPWNSSAHCWRDGQAPSPWVAKS